MDKDMTIGIKSLALQFMNEKEATKEWNEKGLSSPS
jgi:hypothetical protein